ncbi:MAG: nucleotide exchange factor GrpE [Prevotella sp.]|nr:nucleotide exchange factor GrpE [Prevotella sp.]MDY6130146.1 nucleotide exchange factor GrpE [Prevotella sp.]
MSEEKQTNKDEGIEKENIQNENLKVQNDEQDATEGMNEENASAAEENQERPESEEEKEQKKTPLEKAEEEIEALRDKYLRSVAEFENYRKRTIKEKAELILNGGEKTVSAILPVLDDFERALADKTQDATALKEGMDLIFKKFFKTLEGLGVKKIETEGKDFNVDYHEAIAMVPGMGDDKKGKVIDCVLTGYMLNEKVIRHAKVAVGQ